MSVLNSTLKPVNKAGCRPMRVKQGRFHSISLRKSCTLPVPILQLLSRNLVTCIVSFPAIWSRASSVFPRSGHVHHHLRLWHVLPRIPRNFITNISSPTHRVGRAFHPLSMERIQSVFVNRPHLEHQLTTSSLLPQACEAGLT
jgi:hypothetical protein